MYVDEAGGHQEAGDVQGLGGGQPEGGTDLEDASAADGHISGDRRRPGAVHDGAAPQEEVGLAAG